MVYLHIDWLINKLLYIVLRYLPMDLGYVSTSKSICSSQVMSNRYAHVLMANLIMCCREREFILIGRRHTKLKTDVFVLSQDNQSPQFVS